MEEAEEWRETTLMVLQRKRRTKIERGQEGRESEEDLQNVEKENAISELGRRISSALRNCSSITYILRTTRRYSPPSLIPSVDMHHQSAEMFRTNSVLADKTCTLSGLQISKSITRLASSGVGKVRTALNYSILLR